MSVALLVPAPKEDALLVNGDCVRELSLMDLDRLLAYARVVGVRRLKYMDNLDARAMTVYPPRGFVAYVPKDAPFVKDCCVGERRLFRGIAYLSIKMPRPSDELLKKWREQLRAFTLERDETIGIYEASISRHGLDRPQYEVMVFDHADLPSAMYESLLKHLQRATGTMGDILIKSFKKWRDAALETRTRRLGDVVRALELGAPLEEVTDERERCFRATGVTHVVTHDFVEGEKEIAIASGCASSLDGPLVRFEGEEVAIFNADDASTPRVDSGASFACEPPHRSTKELSERYGDLAPRSRYQTVSLVRVCGEALRVTRERVPA